MGAQEGEYKPWIKVGTSVVVRRVNAIHCGLPASLCVHTVSYAPSYIHPSVSVCVGKYIRFIGERDRAARKGHTLPTLQWYLKPLFPKGSFAFCCCAFRYRSILFPFFSFRTRQIRTARKKLRREFIKIFIRKLTYNRFGLLLSFLSSIRIDTRLAVSPRNLILYKIDTITILLYFVEVFCVIFFSKINNKLARWYHMLHQKKGTTVKKKKKKLNASHEERRDIFAA